MGHCGWNILAYLAYLAYLAGSGYLKTYERTCFGILFVAEGPIDYKLTEFLLMLSRGLIPARSLYS